MISPNPLSPTASTSSAIKTPENTEEDPDDFELADEGNIQMELYRPNSSSNKQLPARIWVSVLTVPSDTPEYWINWHLCSPMWFGLTEFCCTVYELHIVI